MESPERFEEIKPALVDELWKVAQRELDTAFIMERLMKINNSLGLVVKFLSTNSSEKLLPLMLKQW